MYVVRITFYAKPGCGSELSEKLKAAAPHFEALGVRRARVLSDVMATTWTISVELEVDSLATYFDNQDARDRNPEFAAAMAGYTDLVTGGKREIFRVV